MLYHSADNQENACGLLSSLHDLAGSIGCRPRRLSRLGPKKKGTDRASLHFHSLPGQHRGQISLVDGLDLATPSSRRAIADGQAGTSCPVSLCCPSG